MFPQISDCIASSLRMAAFAFLRQRWVREHQRQSGLVDLGIDLEEKAFYDILKNLAIKYDFSYPDDRLLSLAKAVKVVVDDKVKYTDWSRREDIKAELKVDLILVLAKHGYPPVDRDEVYKEIFEQAENFKKYRIGK